MERLPRRRQGGVTRVHRGQVIAARGNTPTRTDSEPPSLRVTETPEHCIVAPEFPNPEARMNWNDVLDALRTLPFRSERSVARQLVAHPSTIPGFVRSSGLAKGQFADWRYTFDDCVDLHVREFHDVYEVHLDEVAPSCDLSEHVRVDAPEVYVAAGATTGAAIGALLGRSVGGVLLGSMLGALVSATMLDAPARRLRRSA